MEFTWQTSRGEALYVEQESKRIVGFVYWKDENRLNIDAMALDHVTGGTFKPVGKFFDEKKAKEAVEEAVASLLAEPKPLVADHTKEHVVKK